MSDQSYPYPSFPSSPRQETRPGENPLEQNKKARELACKLFGEGKSSQEVRDILCSEFGLPAKSWLQNRLREARVMLGIHQPLSKQTRKAIKRQQNKEAHRDGYRPRRRSF